MNKFSLESSSIAAENPFTRIVREKLVRADGHSLDYLIVERGLAIAVLPLFQHEGALCTALVYQYRHPIAQMIYQFPMGGLEADASAEETAKKELQEETGLVAKSFVRVSEYFVDPGLSRQKCQVYIATEITGDVGQSLESSEEGMTVRFVPVKDLKNMMKTGEICDSWTIAQVAILLDYVQVSELK